MSLVLRHRARTGRGAGLASKRRGLSVIEIVVALTLFGTVTIAMAGLSLAVARRAEANDVFTKRTALLQQQMNRLQTIPYDSLADKAGSVVVSTGPFPHERKISIHSSGSRTRVVVQIIPAHAPDRAETIAFDRAKPTTSPLCKEC